MLSTLTKGTSALSEGCVMRAFLSPGAQVDACQHAAHRPALRFRWWEWSAAAALRFAQ